MQKLQEDIQSIQSSMASLQLEVRLSSLRDSVEDLQTKVNNQAQRIRDLRSRGYVFGKELENQANSLAQQWAAVHPSVSSQIESQAMTLQMEMHRIEGQFGQLAAHSADPVGARPLVLQMQSLINTMRSNASAASNSIHGMFNKLEEQVRQFETALTEIDWTLTQLAEASFRLLPTEGAIAAVKAVWVQGVKENDTDPKGVLYLTDQRLLFEQKQEIATKKVLFITTEKKKVQELKLESPITQIGDVKPSKRGLLGHEDHLDVSFSAEVPYAVAHWHIDGQDCNRWAGLLGRAKSGDFERDRAVALDQASVEKVAAAPTVCPNCGAALPPVLRGMDSIKCEFCGKVTRL